MDGGTVEGTKDTSAGIWGDVPGTDPDQANNITVTGGTVTGGGFGGIYKVSNGTLDIGGNAVVSGTNHGVRLQNRVNTVTIRERATIQTTSDDALSPYALYNSGSEVTITGGTITSNHPTNGFGIRNTDGGIVTIERGTVEAIKAINNSGILNIVQGADIIGTEYGIYNDAAEAGNVSISGGRIRASGAGSSGIYNAAGDMTISGDTRINGEKYGIHNKGGTITIAEGVDIPVRVEKRAKTQDGYVLYAEGTDSRFNIGDGTELWFYTNQDEEVPWFCVQNDGAGDIKVDEGIPSVPSTDGSSYCFELIWQAGT